jgi:hypothetical protein
VTHDENDSQGPQGPDARTPLDARLDARLQELPLAAMPGRDLWPGIASRIEQIDAAIPIATRRRAWVWQAAAAVVLVAGSSLLTASLLDKARPTGQSAGQSAVQRSGQPTIPGATIVPAAFGPAGTLDGDYLTARQQLTRMLDERISLLPPSARAKLEFNLGEMRRAADEINAALAAQPGDPLLEELLLKTYQDELAVLSNVNELTNGLQRTSAPAGEKRMQL